MKNKPVFLICISLALFLILPSVATAAGPAVEKLLREAETAFAEANELFRDNPEAAMPFYRKSADYYNSLISGGIRNAGLYYNTANAYVRLGMIGEAVLNYRRALLYEPNNREILNNLEYARSLQKNGFEPDSGYGILRILFFWHWVIPAGWKTGLLIAANLVFWTLLILRRFGYRLRKSAAVAVAAAAVFAVSLGFDLHASNTICGVVTAEQTIGRLGDSRSYESAFDGPIYQGAEFTLVLRRVGWLLAELPDGEQVWLEEAACSLVED